MLRFPLALAGRPALTPCQAGGRARSMALPQRHSSPAACFSHAQTGSPDTCCLVGSSPGRLCLVCEGHTLPRVQAPPGLGTWRELRCAKDTNSPKTPVFWGTPWHFPTEQPQQHRLLLRPAADTSPPGHRRTTGHRHGLGAGACGLWGLQSSHAAGFADRFPIPLIAKGCCGPRKRELCTPRPHRGGVHSPGVCSAVPRWRWSWQ